MIRFAIALFVVVASPRAWAGDPEHYLASASDAFHDDRPEDALAQLEQARGFAAPPAVRVRIELWRAVALMALRDHDDDARAAVVQALAIDPDLVVGLDEFWPSFATFVEAVRAATPTVTVPKAVPVVVEVQRSDPPVRRPVPRPRSARRAWIGGDLVLMTSNDTTLSAGPERFTVRTDGMGGGLVAGIEPYAGTLRVFADARLRGIAYGRVHDATDPAGASVGSGGWSASLDTRLGGSGRWLDGIVGAELYAVASGLMHRRNGIRMETTFADLIGSHAIVALGVGAGLELRWAPFAITTEMRTQPLAHVVEHHGSGTPVSASAGELAVGMRWQPRAFLELGAMFTYRSTDLVLVDDERTVTMRDIYGDLRISLTYFR